MVHVANRTGATCQFGYRLDATYASIHGMSPSVTWFRPDREVNFLRNLLTGEVVQNPTDRQVWNACGMLVENTPPWSVQ